MKIERLEKLVYGSFLAQAKAGLPDGFNEAVLQGLDPVEQIEFINRFKAALPQPAEKPAAERKLGATVPAKPAKPTEGPEPGSMAERSKAFQDQLKARTSKSAIVTGFYR